MSNAIFKLDRVRPEDFAHFDSWIHDVVEVSGKDSAKIRRDNIRKLDPRNMLIFEPGGNELVPLVEMLRSSTHQIVVGGRRETRMCITLKVRGVYEIECAGGRQEHIIPMVYIRKIFGLVKSFLPTDDAV